MAFFKDPFGVVHLKGLAALSFTAGDIFVLPVGYRPAKIEVFLTLWQNQAVSIDIEPDGSVFERVSGGWISLNGITFRAAQ